MTRDPPAAVHSAMGEQLRAALAPAIAQTPSVRVHGRVVEALGTLVCAAGVEAQIGELCELRLANGSQRLAEVVGFTAGRVLLAPYGDAAGLSPGTAVLPLGHAHRTPVGPALLGRVVDGFGTPIDGLGPLQGATLAAADAPPPDALARRPVQHRFDTGVRVIDLLATIGEGQRVGVFAPAGVGKSTLAGMLVQGAASDVAVIALVGERGREVGEFIAHHMASERRARTVLVVTTSDRPALERVRSAAVATALAESFRDQGQRVLLIMDSVTRYARALREIGLARGEPPTRRGYPPSVFAALPRLLERAGNAARGSITAFYIVLTEGEDDDDPIAEEVRSILDGHITLSRALAQANQFPAVQPLASLSRVMHAVAEPEHQAAASHVRSLLAKHRDIELLLQVGEFRAGSDALADEAIAKMPALRALLAQRHDEVADATAARATLQALLKS